jgi:acetyl-CoA carboxylase biotin carboxylase subunit
MFRKVLIANRGEIAVRILRACREMGISTVAVYSEVDRMALHVRLADDAVPIGPPAAALSYLSIENLIRAAQITGAEAVHPGYGFLAENTAFAEAVAGAGLTFIGPPAEAIRVMGDKAEARARMQSAQVPVVPGYQGPDDPASLTAAAAELGYPVLVKAAAGGGGKGMRVVGEASGLREAIGAARREAAHAFGDDRLILECFIPKARHIEFQILADGYGNVLHLFERECSVQRRHQKIIEETPSPFLDEELREKMGAAAVAAARATGYQNAGTIEFIIDPARRSFYFLEMNTRLQVEHPVTELVTGLDVVQWQLRIAAGEALPFAQKQLSQRGHAIECRLYAEDPANNFLPASGRLLRFIEPTGPGVRVDSGFISGDEITVHYDPLIAKLIVYAEDRPSAIRKIRSALRETVILGLTTNWQFLNDVLAAPDFLAGKVYTTWVEESFEDWQPAHCDLPEEVLAAAALAQFKQEPAGSSQGLLVTNPIDDPYSPWRAENGYRTGET